MKSNQKGFSVIEILVVVVMIGLIGMVGLLVYGHQKNNSAAKQTSTQEKNEISKQDTTENASAKPKADTTIHETDIKLQKESDISMLPDYTPSSFKSYMLNLLKNNKPYDSGQGVMVTPQYAISKISQVNILGGQAPVDKDGNGYPGGAPAIWVLTPAGTWDEESLNGPVCKSKNGGVVYEEFVKECVDASGAFVKNPNGSIKTLAQ